MNLTGFLPTSTLLTISATTASTVNQLATTLSAAENVRIVNDAATRVYVSISTSTSADATADARRMPVLGKTERIFAWPPGGNTMSVALSSGTGTVEVQLGKGF